MKKIIFVIIAICCAVMANGAKNPTCLIEEVFAPSHKTKTVYEYDQSGNLTQELYLTWDFQNGTWKARNQMEYFYNEQGQLMEKQTINWNSWLNDWEPVSKEEYTYNSDGKLVTKINNESYLMPGKTLEFRSKEEFSYSGNVVTDIYSSYNFTTSIWDVCVEHVITNNAAGNMLSNYSYRWNGSDWGNLSKAENIYESGKLKTACTYYWREGTEVWDNQTKEEYSYESGQTTMVHYEGKESSWMATTKTVYAYDIDGDLVTATLYHWSNDTSDWVAFSLSSYYYNGDPEGMDEITQQPTANSQKLLINGNFYILRDNKTYDMTGKEVR